MANRKPLIDDTGEVRELTAQDFARAHPAAEMLPTILGQAVAAELLAKRGRPKAETPKVFTGIRLDADVVATFKASGKVWQTRVNAALREWLKTHSPA